MGTRLTRRTLLLAAASAGSAAWARASDGEPTGSTPRSAAVPAAPAAPAVRPTRAVRTVRTVPMAFGERIPPFCFPKTASGIEVDVFREALALTGYTLAPRFYPFARVPLAFRQGEVDATMTDLGQDLTAFGGHYGDTAVLYDNVLITRTDRQRVLRRPADLNGLQIVSFPGALRRFPEWLQAADEAGRYREIGDQAAHVRMLMLGHCDVVLSDRTIFRYFSLQERHNPQGVPVVPVTQHFFTTPDPDDYRPVFRSPVVRDAFNDGLRQLKASGRYRAIFDRYMKE